MKNKKKTPKGAPRNIRFAQDEEEFLSRLMVNDASSFASAVRKCVRQLMNKEQR